MKLRKEEAAEARPDDGTLRTTTISDAVTASEAAAKAEVAYETAMKKVKAARATSEAAWKKEYEAIKAEVVETKETGQFSNKRKQDRIFRREMGEPEFFLMDTGLVKPILTGDEIEEIARKSTDTKRSKPQNTIQKMYSALNLVEPLIMNLV